MPDDPKKFRGHLQKGGFEEDPPASVLTQTQREFLFGDRDVEGAQKRALQRRIRRRIQAALFDFQLIAYEIGHDELEKIFERELGHLLPTKSLVSFLYQAHSNTRELDVDVFAAQHPEEVDQQTLELIRDVKTGIEEVIQYREGVEAEAEVSISVERKQDLEELAEDDLTQHTRRQLEDLLAAGLISAEEYGTAVESKLQEEEGFNG